MILLMNKHPPEKLWRVIDIFPVVEPLCVCEKPQCLHVRRLELECMSFAQRNPTYGHYGHLVWPNISDITHLKYTAGT